MLTPLIAFQNNHHVTAAATARKSAGPSSNRPRPDVTTPHYFVMDFIAAATTFPEIAGEDPNARSQRRLQWVREALPYVKEQREKREATAFMMGAQIADAAAREELSARVSVVEQPSLDQIADLIKIIDEVRATRPIERREHGSTGVALAIGVAIGIVIGVRVAGHGR